MTPLPIPLCFRPVRSPVRACLRARPSGGVVDRLPSTFIPTFIRKTPDSFSSRLLQRDSRRVLSGASIPVRSPTFVKCGLRDWPFQLSCCTWIVR